MGERRRARPGRVTHPITENATAVIDKSFDILFRDLEVLTDSTPVSRGGTGLAGYAKGDLLYASGVDVLATLAITTTAGRFLRSDGALPEWSALVLPNASVTGDLLYASGTNVIGALADIATGNALLSGGIGVAPAWGKVGLTTHVTGTLPVANGGTNTTSYTAGSVIFAGASGTSLTHDNAMFFWNDSNDDLLIGRASNPLSALTLLGRGFAVMKDSNAEVQVLAAGTGVFGGLRFNTFTGTLSSPAATATGTGGFISMGGYGSALTLAKAGITLYAAEGWTGSAQGTRIGFEVTPLLSTTRTERIRIQSSGGLSVGNAMLSTDPGEGGLALGTVLDEIYGGTGLTSYTQGDLVYASGANTLAKLAKDANATRYLSNTGGSNNPAWAQVNLANGVTGNLPVTNLNSGTLADATTFWRGDGSWAAPTASAAAHALLSASHNDTVAQGVTRGSLVYGNVTPAWDELVIGAANRVLRSDGVDLAWSQVALATDVSGTLPVGNGGTGVVTFAANGVLYGNAAGVVQVTAQGAANSVLTANAGAPVFSAAPVIGTSISVATAETAGLINLPSTESNTPKVQWHHDSTTSDGAISTYTDASGIYITIGSNVYINSVGSVARFNSGGASSMFQFEPGNFSVWTGGTGADPVVRFVIGNAGAVRMYAYGAGTATFDASGNISSVSDERLKTKIRPFIGGLPELLAITPIAFHYTKASGLDTENIYTGFSAQNVLAVLPTAVGEGPDGFYTLNDRALLAATVNAIHTLQSEIDELNAAASLSPFSRTVSKPRYGAGGIVRSRPRSSQENN